MRAGPRISRRVNRRALELGLRALRAVSNALKVGQSSSSASPAVILHVLIPRTAVRGRRTSSGYDSLLPFAFKVVFRPIMLLRMSFQNGAPSETRRPMINNPGISMYGWS